MGKKIPGVSYLFGRLTRKKTKSRNENLTGDETSAITPARTSYSGGGESSSMDEPPLPGKHHMRTTSCHHQQHSRPKLVWSLSTGGRSQNLRRAEKKLKHEDSIWKKTIILGERCRVLDEDDDDTILYDENGNRISTYHPKNTTGFMSFSRQNSSIDQRFNDELSRK